MEGVEAVTSAGLVLAYVIRSSVSPDSTTFITQNDANMQAGFVVYRVGGEVKPHVHLPLERRVVGTAEFIQVRSGRCVVDVYTSERELVTTTELGPGDAILTLEGGHGFRMLEDTVLLELKQGPFFDGRDKERFERQAQVPRP